MDFAGVCLVAPYFALHDPRMMERLKPAIQMFGKVSPNKEIPMGEKVKKKHLEQVRSDPLYYGSTITPNNILVNDQAMQAFSADRIASKMKAPTLLVLGGKDTVVSN